MGYKYQNRLDEERERLYWEKRPRWLRKLAHVVGWVFLVFFAILAAYGSVGWVIAAIIRQYTDGA